MAASTASTISGDDLNTQKQQQHTFRQHYEQSKHQQQHHQQQQNAPVPKQRELLDHLFEQYRKELRPVLNEQTVIIFI